MRRRWLLVPLAALAVGACPRPPRPPCVAARQEQSCTEDHEPLLPGMLFLLLNGPKELPLAPDWPALEPVEGAPLELAPPRASERAPAGERAWLPPPIMEYAPRYPSFVGPPPRAPSAGGTE